MLMKDVLNVFQSDWASTPALKYEDSNFDINLNNINDKTVLISGKYMALCFAYTIVNLKDKKNFNAKVILAPTCSDFGNKIPDGVLQRDDFIFTEFERICDIKQKIDYIFHT